jgi:predicted O-methyltransferase YrrM
MGREVRNHDKFSKTISDIKLDEIWMDAQKFKIKQKQNEWFTFLNEICKLGDPVDIIIEIGSYDGGSTVSLSHITKELITIDMAVTPRFDEFGYPEGSQVKGSAYIRQKCKFLMTQPNSHNVTTLEEVKQILNGRKVDVLFIDGDNTQQGVKQDFNLYSEFVKEGGLIGVHNILKSEFHTQHGCFIHDFWDEIKSKFDGVEIIDDFAIEKTNDEWGGIGIIKVTKELLETVEASNNQPTIDNNSFIQPGANTNTVVQSNGGSMLDNASYMGGINY